MATFWDHVVDEENIETLKRLDIVNRKTMWIFRASPKKNFSSTFDRLCERARIKNRNKRRELEAKILREFMRAAHHYMTELEEPLPPRKALAEWMSLGRHYGIPSRLIDFSYSRYVALYFALHDWSSDDDSYVLCINAQWLVDQVHPEKRLNKLLKDKASLPYRIASHAGISDNQYDFHNPRMFHGFVFSAWKDGKPIDNPPFVSVAPVSPFRLNRRIIEQRGLFLCPSDAGKSFDDNLEELFKDQNGHVQENLVRTNVKSFKLPNKLQFQKNQLAMMKRMNVSTRTLYADLSGYAGSLSDQAFYGSWAVKRTELRRITEYDDPYV